MPTLFSNPLVRLEFLRRFRGGLAAWGIPLMVLLPGAAVVIAYQAGTAIQQNDFFGQPDEFFIDENGMEVVGVGPDMGFDEMGEPQQLNRGVSVGQVDDFGEPMLIALIVTAIGALMILVPAVAGGAISSERDAQTLQPLQLTALGPSEIVLGKLVASMAYLLLLLVCLAPALTIPFLVGGVSLSGVLKSFGLLFLVCVELAAVALAVSAALRRAVTSIITSLLLTGVLMIGPFVAMGFFFLIGSRDPGFQGDISVFRLVAAVSPVSIFSWVGDLGTVNTGEFAGTSGRVWSMAFWVVITTVSLLIARRSVTAPTVKDR